MEVRFLRSSDSESILSALFSRVADERAHSVQLAVAATKSRDPAIIFNNCCRLSSLQDHVERQNELLLAIAAKVGAELDSRGKQIVSKPKVAPRLSTIGDVSPRQ